VVDLKTADLTTWRAAPQSDGDRSVMNFATVQLFSLIYLQKFAFGPQSGQIPLTLVIMQGGLGWMLVNHHAYVSGRRLAWFLTFASCCLFAQVIAGTTGSLLSFVELLLLYSWWTLSVDLSEATYRAILAKFVNLMILPAGIIIFQFIYQKATGLSNPLNMNRLLPASIMAQGFIYEGPLTWGYSFMRPNGFFFLETSFASLFAATAAIIEICHSRRPRIIMLMLTATLLTLGGTGIIMLLVATPFLLVREKPHVVGVVVVLAGLGLTIAILADVQIPLVSRIDELHKGGSSGEGRLITPAIDLLTLLADPAYTFGGSGPGSTGPEYGSAWPSLKLTVEYGFLALIAYVVLYASAISGRRNLPLKVAITVVFQFTGGYLLNCEIIEFVLLFFIIAPRALTATPGRRSAIGASHVPAIHSGAGG
jgi:hypothetical protein